MTPLGTWLETPADLRSYQVADGIDTARATPQTLRLHPAVDGVMLRLSEGSLHMTVRLGPAGLRHLQALCARELERLALYAAEDAASP